MLNTTSSARPASKLNRAIALSVAAMVAMNIFVLAQQLHPAPSLAAGPVAGQQA